MFEIKTKTEKDAVKILKEPEQITFNLMIKCECVIATSKLQFKLQTAELTLMKIVHEIKAAC